MRLMYDPEWLDEAGAWRRPMSTTQVAEALCVARRTVCDWIAFGVLPARKIGGTWQVSRLVVQRIVTNAVKAEMLVE